MKLINKTEENIKIEIEETNPRVFTTIRKGETIETNNRVFVNYYMKEGLTELKEKLVEVKAEEKSEVKAVESKAGPAIVETKTIEKLKDNIKEVEKPKVTFLKKKK